MTRLFVPVLFMLICWACTGAERSASNVLHLTELFDEADVQGSVAPNDGDGALLEWRFDGETTPNFASDAIDALQIRDARLQGRSVDAFPVVVLDGRVAEAINPDLVYAFEVKARISAGSNLAVEIGDVDVHDPTARVGGELAGIACDAVVKACGDGKKHVAVLDRHIRPVAAVTSFNKFSKFFWILYNFIKFF